MPDVRPGRSLLQGERWAGNGWRDGPCRHLYANGLTREAGIYLDNRRHGEWRRFTEHGALRARHVYRNGFIDDVRWY